MDRPGFRTSQHFRRSLSRIRLLLPGQGEEWRAPLARLRRLSRRYRLRPAPVWERALPAEVLLLVATYGNGHIQAGRATLHAMMRERPSTRALMLDFFDMVNPVFNAATRFAYIYSVREAPTLWREFYWRTARIRPESFLQNRLFHLGAEKVRRLLERTGARVAVSTHPTPAGVVAQLAVEGQLPLTRDGRPPAAITVITDYVLHSQWVHPHTDLYLVPTAEVADDLVSRGIEARRIAVTGIPIRSVFHRPPPRAAARREWGLQEDVPAVVVLTGAYGMMRNAVDACRRLAFLQEPMQLIVVAGRDVELARRIREATAGAPNPTRVTGYVDAIASLMAAADLVVTKAGGLTVSEALAVGVPMVIYAPIPGQEEGNAAFLRRHRAAEVALDPDDLESVVRFLLRQADRRDQMASIARSLGRPDAAEQAAALVLERAIS